ncbi:DUF4350 domain-containing protein [Ancylothrix sp. C2]|uniref:DUF4350 domain-containing protein n=1 Tax=Ancylothrix sp. D3o TaxID=2953691 RepID=UPI0021BA4186|nr:DUF4350 domain-containing protein [Ancylothrix sp. D3o]MCT7950646.1 DUF4350 domain-containing protein [Ancylothrix sp. D3o]
MRFSNRRIWFFLALAVVLMVLLTLLVAPANNRLTVGSTYGRSPDGYGAWYAYMQEQGVPVVRWQKSFAELANSQPENITLLRVNSGLSSGRLSSQEIDWLRLGNRLVVLGIRQPVTEAKFSSILKADVGGVKIETSRRLNLGDMKQEKSLLDDRFGSTVWQKTIDKGLVINSVTPHLGANAYQDETGNYEFLAQLVREKNQRIFVDEYMHGYRDKTAQTEKSTDDVFSYLLRSPVFMAILQGLVVVLIWILAERRRFGKAQSLVVPVVDNSEAYIRATAGVLEKAEMTDFVMEMLAKEEQLEFQKKLGLGSELLPPNVLVSAWVSQTGRPASELSSLLAMNAKKAKFSKTNLKKWLEKWQRVRAGLFQG